MQFMTEDNSIITMRPSGTEPKIKFYFSVNEPIEKRADYVDTKNTLQDRIKSIIEDLKL